MKNILCFGDSNTFGHHPTTGGRYEIKERWTGILQELLGKEYRVIEEGCDSRTTCLEDPFEPYKNGSIALPICLESHRPLNLIIMCLGTNDLKTRFCLSSNDIARGMGNLVKIAKRFDYGENFLSPQILVMSPVRICPGVENRPLSSFAKESVTLSTELPHKYNEIAKTHNCFFFDSGSVAQASKEDYIHMTPESHQALAAALLTQVKNILG